MYDKIIAKDPRIGDAPAMQGGMAGMTPTLSEGAQESHNACASQSLRSRAMQKAHQAASESARHERLAEKLTPEIEATLWCWQEAIALGLIDGRVLNDNMHRLHNSDRDRQIVSEVN